MQVVPQLAMAGRVLGILVWCGILAFLVALGKKRPRAAWALAIPCLALMLAAVVTLVQDAGLDEFGFQLMLFLGGGYFIYLVVLVVNRVLSRY